MDVTESQPLFDRSLRLRRDQFATDVKLEHD
jgi:hypothetical protein